jgi:hypothetical protein
LDAKGAANSRTGGGAGVAERGPGCEKKRMKLALPLLPAFLLAACTTQVSHPTKTLAEQQVDIDLCTREANHKYWMDPVAALLNAYDCLEARGYRKEKAGLRELVERAAGEDRAQRRNPNDPTKPCTVPCR